VGVSSPPIQGRAELSPAPPPTPDRLILTWVRRLPQIARAHPVLMILGILLSTSLWQVVQNPMLLFVLNPVSAVGLGVFVLLAINRKGLRSHTPVLRSRFKLLAAAGWVALVLVWSILSTLDLLFVVSTVVMLIYVVLAIWESTAKSQLSMMQRSVRLTVLWLVPPLALALWIVPRRSGWGRIAAVFATLAALRIELAAAFLWNFTLHDTGKVDLNAVLQSVQAVLPTFALTAGILVFVVGFIQFVYSTGQPRWATPSGLQSDGQDATSTPASAVLKPANIAARCFGAFLCFASWFAIVAFNLVPWVIISLWGPHQSAWVTAARTLSAAAIALISGSALARIIWVQVRKGASWLPNDALPAIAAALLLAIALTFASVFAAAFPGGAQPLGWGLSIGLSLGLSVGLGQALGLKKRLVEASSSLVAVGLCAMLVIWVVADPSQRWSPFGSLAGLAIGLVAGELLLVPGLAAFARILPYLRRLLLPLIGFATGYLFIIFSFAALFFATYIRDGSSFSVSGRPPQLWDFIYFSLNTIAPLGYTGLKPSSSLAEAMSGVELVAGIAWLVGERFLPH